MRELIKLVLGLGVYMGALFASAWAFSSAFSLDWKHGKMAVFAFFLVIWAKDYWDDL